MSPYRTSRSFCPLPTPCRSWGLSQPIACPRRCLPALACLLSPPHRRLILRNLRHRLTPKPPWNPFPLNFRIHLHEPAATPAPKAVSPPPSASVTAFGYLWNARSNVVHVAMRTEPSATRSKSFLLDGSTVWLRPLCGARTHQLDPDSFCLKAPDDAILCTRTSCFSRWAA